MLVIRNGLRYCGIARHEDTKLEPWSWRSRKKQNDAVCSGRIRSTTIAGPAEGSVMGVSFQRVEVKRRYDQDSFSSPSDRNLEGFWVGHGLFEILHALGGEKMGALAAGFAVGAG